MNTSTNLNATLQNEQIARFQDRKRNRPSDMLFRFWWVPVVLSLLTSGVISFSGFDFGSIGYAFKDLVPNVLMFIPSCVLTTLAIDQYDHEMAFHQLGRANFTEEKLLHVGLVAIPIVAILLVNHFNVEYYLVQISAALIFASVPVSVMVLTRVAARMRPAPGAATNDRAHLRAPIEVGAMLALAAVLAIADAVLVSAFPTIWQL